MTDEGVDELIRVTKQIRAVLRVRTRCKRITIHLDLRQTSEMTAGAAVKIHAELDVLRGLRRKVILVRCRTRSGTSVSHLVSASGLGKSVPPDTAQDGVIPMQTGSTKPDMHDLFRKMNRSFYGGQIVMDDDQWLDLSESIQEATANVQEHAYATPERRDYVKRDLDRWWIFGHTDDSWINFVIFDKGQGIPKRFPTNPDFRIIDRFSRIARITKTDSWLIVLAYKYSVHNRKRRSGGRGNGFAIMSEMVEDGGAELYIRSNRGWAYFRGGHEPVHSDNVRSFHGTLIQIRIPLPGRPS